MNAATGTVRMSTIPNDRLCAKIREDIEREGRRSFAAELMNREGLIQLASIPGHANYDPDIMRVCLRERRHSAPTLRNNGVMQDKCEVTELRDHTAHASSSDGRSNGAVTADDNEVTEVEDNTVPPSSSE